MTVVAGERHVKDTPQNRQLNAVKLAEDLSVYTTKICSNKNIFIEEYEDTTKDIVKTASNIYLKSFYANGIYVKDKESKEKRLKLQEEALDDCAMLVGNINLAYRLFHLKMKKKRHWIKMTLDARSSIKGWHESDKKRYKKYE